MIKDDFLRGVHRPMGPFCMKVNEEGCPPNVLKTTMICIKPLQFRKLLLLKCQKYRFTFQEKFDHAAIN